MKIWIFIFFLLLVPSNNILAKDLIIVEIGIRSNSLIKIHNPAPETINISGYRIRRKSSTGKEYSVRVIPKDTIISPNGYFIWSTSRNDFHLSQNAHIWSTTTLSINNSIALIDSKGNIIDALAWGEGKNQFYLNVHFPINPNAEQKIKRLIENNEYINNKDNSKDFYIYPKIKDDIIIDIKKESINRENKFPLANAITISVLSGLVAVSIKRLI